MHVHEPLGGLGIQSDRVSWGTWFKLASGDLQALISHDYGGKPEGVAKLIVQLCFLLC